MQDFEEFKQHFNSKIINEYIKFFRNKEKNLDILNEISNLGVDLKYFEDQNNWVSVAYMKKFNELLNNSYEKRHIHYEVGEFSVSKEGLGSLLYSLAKNIIPLKNLYHNILSHHEHFNKIIDIKVVQHINNEIKLLISPKKHALKDYEIKFVEYCFPSIIENTIGFYESFPKIKGLPKFKINSIKQNETTYELSFVYPNEKTSIVRFKKIATLVLFNFLFIVMIALNKNIFFNFFQLINTNIIIFLLSKYFNVKEISQSSLENLKKIDDQYKDLYEAKLVVQKKLIEESAINKLTNNMIKSVSEHEILNIVCRDLKETLSFDRTLIYLADEEKNFLSYSAGSLADEKSVFKDIKFEININDNNIYKISNVFRNRKAVLVTNAELNSEGFSKEGRELIKFSGSKSYVAVPIFSENESFGVLFADRLDSSKDLDQNDLNLLQLICCQIAITIEKNRSQVKLKKSYDEIFNLAESFSKFVPLSSLKLLNYKSIHEVKIGHGVEQELTILFSDIRNFTSLSEQMSPVETLLFLNSYFSKISPIVKNYDGIIDKYIGDCIMIIFENPQNAVNAGVEIQREIIKYNLNRIIENRPTIEAGVGISTGPVIAGPLGFDGRLEITVLADTVNTASRLDSYCKILKSKVLISESTFQKIILIENLSYRLHSDVELKGKNKKINIYEIIDDNIDKIELSLPPAKAS